ncbi:hypothetical protein [Amycolatopsis sp. NPDC058986]|uniref:hypothetical protein n=1 Tax=unclassified Amycolatopsis TaxID=2618356 RepID=UPI00366B8022
MIALWLMLGIVVIVLIGLVVALVSRKKGRDDLRAFATSQGGRWHDSGSGTHPGFGVRPDERYTFALEFGRQSVPVVAFQGVDTVGGDTTVWHKVRVGAPMTPRLCLYKIGPVDRPDSPMHRMMLRTYIPASVSRELAEWPVPDPALRPLIAVYTADPRFADTVLTPAFLHWYAGAVPPLSPGIDVGDGVASSRITGPMSIASVTQVTDRLLAVAHGIAR